MEATELKKDKQTVVGGSFLSDLQEFWCHRIARYELGHVSPDYREIQISVAKTAVKLLGCLPEEEHQTFVDLIESHTTMEAEAEAVAYRHGFSDGVRLIMQSVMGTSM